MKKLYQQIRQFIEERWGIIKVIFAFSFFIFVIRELVRIILDSNKEHSYVKIDFLNLHWSTFLILVLLGLLSVFPMIIYDFAVVKFLGEKFKPIKIITNGFIANTFTNLINYRNQLDAGIRSKLYSDDFDNEDMAKTIHKFDVFFPAGLALFSGLALIIALSISSVSYLDSYWFWYLGYFLYFPIRYYIHKRHNPGEYENVTVKRTLELCSASILKYVIKIILFLMIGYLMIGRIEYSFILVFLIFILANIIGKFSLLPAGFGAFDFILIIELSMIGVPISVAIAWDIVYRLIYDIIPFICGLLLFLYIYGKKVNDFLDDLPKTIIQRVAQIIVTGYLYFAGIMLLLLSTVPNIALSNQIYLSLEPYSFYFLNQLTTIVFAIVLIGLARGIGSKVKRAFWPALIVLLISMGNTLWKQDFPITMCVTFIFILLCLWCSHGILYRTRLSHSWGQIIMDIIVFAGTFILYTIVGIYNFISFHSHHWQLHHFNSAYFFPSQQIWLAGFIGLIAASLILVLIYRFLSSGKDTWLEEGFDSERVHHVIDEFGGNDVSHLAFVRDKHIYFYTENGEDQVFFMYKHIANKLIIMGEPVGNSDKIEDALDKFMVDADQQGLSLVFYEVGENFTMMLHEKGFDFTKTGEEGLVDLSKFTLVGKKHRGERALIHKFERENYKFEILNPPFSNDFINELRNVSDQWLHGNPEKGFSLGYFDDYYLQQAPIAVMKDENGKVMAFANLMPTGDHNITSIDLMRSDNDSPSGIMDGIFINLFQKSLEDGYHYFNLGMAPLSNVGESRFSFIDEKIANLIYQYGQAFYSFKGLRSYKEKYVNKWVPRYITYRRRSSLVFTMIQILIIVNKKMTNNHEDKNKLFRWIFTKND